MISVSMIMMIKKSDATENCRFLNIFENVKYKIQTVIVVINKIDFYPHF